MLLVGSSWTASASAQTPAEPTATPTSQPPAAEPSPAAPAAATPAAAPAEPSKETKEQEDDGPGSQARFRWAVHAVGGPWFVPDRTGGGGGIGVQLGVQINDLVGVYYSGTGALGVAGSNDAAGVGASFGAWAYNAIMADITLARIFQVGLGPSLDSLAFASADVKATPNAPTQKAVALAGTYVGVQGRVGVALGGGSKPGKAGRFMLGLEVH
ncbi:MAG TPA: hypothetical protein VM580_10435, partial [Labilithrix sp.]|nr:hypothetical protein [Labilithrix sp.]